MAITAKKKARLREQGLVEKKQEESSANIKQCTCLVSIRGRGQHAIGCALFDQ